MQNVDISFNKPMSTGLPLKIVEKSGINHLFDGDDESSK